MKTTNQFSALLKFIAVPKLLLLLSLLSITACDNRPGANNKNIISTNSTQVIVEYMTAELQGNLVLVNQCLRVNGDDGVSYLLVWPGDFSMKLEGDTAHITQGVVSGVRKDYDLHIGEHIDIGGGTGDVVDTSSFRVSPSHCSGPYWAFGGLVKK